MIRGTWRHLRPFERFLLIGFPLVAVVWPALKPFDEPLGWTNLLVAFMFGVLWEQTWRKGFDAWLDTKPWRQS